LRRKRLFKKGKKEAFKLQKEKRAKYDKLLSQIIKERKAHHIKKDEAHAEAAPAKTNEKAAATTKKVDVPKAAEEKKKEGKGKATGTAKTVTQPATTAPVAKGATVPKESQPKAGGKAEVAKGKGKGKQ